MACSIPRPVGGDRLGATRLLAYADSKVHSGAEMVFCDVVRGLAQRPGIEVSAAAPAENEELTAALAAATGTDPLEVPAQALPLAAFDLFRPGRLGRAERAIGALAPDVLFVNLPSAEYGALPLRAGLRCLRIGLLHVHGSPRELGFRLGSAREALARRALRGLDAVAVLTPSAEAAYRRLWDPGDTETALLPLPTPVINRRDKAAARAALGLPGGELIGIAGRISFKQKGQDTFVEAARLLARRRPGLRFVVAGEGRDRERLVQMVDRSGAGDRFFMLGQVSPIDDFLGAVDAIAIPSRFEGLPVIALEALAAGTPGIAADIDGLRDVWPGPWLTPPEDAASLAEALDRLLDARPGDTEPLLREGRLRMEQLTSDDPAASIEKLVREVTI